MTNNNIRIAYFSMEIALQPGMPTYAGGLGILAGDTLRSAADMNVPMVAISLLPRRGYFHQTLTDDGWQNETEANWVVEDFLKQTSTCIEVYIDGRPVIIRAWQYQLSGSGDSSVDIYFLDSDSVENSDYDRSLSHFLYGGDGHYRLCQEVILGIGGVRMLEAMGYSGLQRYHLNEGHSSLLILELREQRRRAGDDVNITESVRDLCVFTTHTPVPAGHDKFPLNEVSTVLGPDYSLLGCEDLFCFDNKLNMTYLALANSRYINGVAKKHSQLSRQMYAGYHIDSITNGVHAGTWVCEPMQQLYDQYIPGWRLDNASLRSALNIPCTPILQAHQAAKQALLETVNQHYNQPAKQMEIDIFTIGFARRATVYKRLGLLFSDIERLKSICAKFVRLQIVFAGKAHPNDQQGKLLIQKIIHLANNLNQHINIVFLPDYSINLAKLMVSGCDLWLNTPQPPLEASGTSGMKAALNGVPSLSTMDGWWLEGCLEGLTGWGIGNGESIAEKLTAQGSDQSQLEASLLYNKLEQIILPLYYQNQHGYLEVMRNAIALNGSYFNAERMLNQYIAKAYY